MHYSERIKTILPEPDSPDVTRLEKEIDVIVDFGMRIAEWGDQARGQRPEVGRQTAEYGYELFYT